MVLTQSDLPSLVATAHAAENRLPRNTSDPSDGVRLWPVSPGDTRRAACARRHAALFGASLVEASPDCSRETDLLLAAGRSAHEAGIGRLIWPAHAGVALNPESVDLDRASEIIARALLIERLLELDIGGGLTIETPFADLSDRQIADLSLDLGFVPGDVWWAARSTDEQVREAERWTSAFDAAGVRIGAPAGPADTAG